jgi:hypothetical protein
MLTVRYGTVRDGMTSRSGIIQTFYEETLEIKNLEFRIKNSERENQESLIPSEF